MQKIVSITSQGQLTIPQSFLRSLGIKVPTKAIIEKKAGTLVVKPKTDFWSLSGALTSKVMLTDNELRQARTKFSKSWGKK